MQMWVDFFSNIAPWQRMSILMGGLLIFWMLEGVMPLRARPRTRGAHAGLNLFFYGTTLVINLLFAAVIIKVSDWTQASQFGLLQWVSLPLFWQCLIGIMLLDLVGAWLVHFLEHKIKLMWRFHLVHHTDTYIDATSALRHHPGESVFRALFTTLGVFLVGAPMWIVMMYQAFSALLSQFNHANIQLPSRVEKALSYIIATPDFHKIHHHYVQPYTDANYANIFSIWDRIFGTYLHLDADKIVFGIETHPLAKEHNSLRNLLGVPFAAYRAPDAESNKVPESIDGV